MKASEDLRIFIRISGLFVSGEEGSDQNGTERNLFAIRKGGTLPTSFEDLVFSGPVFPPAHIYWTVQMLRDGEIYEEALSESQEIPCNLLDAFANQAAFNFGTPRIKQHCNLYLKYSINEHGVAHIQIAAQDTEEDEHKVVGSCICSIAVQDR